MHEHDLDAHLEHLDAVEQHRGPDHQHGGGPPLMALSAPTHGSRPPAEPTHAVRNCVTHGGVHSVVEVGPCHGPCTSEVGCLDHAPAAFPFFKLKLFQALIFFTPHEG